MIASAGLPTNAGATTVLKFGYILSADSQLGDGARAFSRELARRTGSRYVVEQYPNALLGGEIAMMKALQVGAVDMAFITGAPLATFAPAVGVFNIPFLFRDVADARALLDGPIGDDYLAAFQSTNIVALAWGENGLRHLTNSKRPIRSPMDLKGLKLRVPQSDIIQAGFKALGVEAQQMSFPLVYGALQSGSVDSEENPIATIVASKFAQVQKFLTLSGHIYDPAVILVSQDVYDSLSTDDRLAFKAAARIGAAASRDSASRKESEGIDNLKAAGMDVVETIDRTAFAEAVAPAAPIFDKRFGHDVIARIRTYRAPPTDPAPARSDPDR